VRSRLSIRIGSFKVSTYLNMFHDGVKVLFSHVSKKFVLLLFLCLVVLSAVVGWLEVDISQKSAKPTMTEMPSPVDVNLCLSGAPPLNETAALNFTITLLQPNIENVNASFHILLPEGFELVSGELSWEGNISTGETVQINALIKAIENGEWTIEGRGTIGTVLQVYDRVYVTVSDEVATVEEYP